MVLVNDLSTFEQKAKEIIRGNPKKAKLSTKYRKEGPIFTMKVTDNTKCYKIKISKDSTFKQAQKVIGTLINLMTSSELL